MKLAIIGWREHIGLPDLGIPGLKAKVDSGARTSALHATHIKYDRDASGKRFVSFRVVSDIQPRRTFRVRVPLLEKRLVKSSTGHESRRPVIVSPILLNGQRWEIEITLVNRDPMGFRMLLGRQALRGRFLIHPSRSFLQSPSEKTS